MTRHRDKVNDYDAWLTQARIDASGDVMVTLDTAYLKEQKRDNNVISRRPNDIISRRGDDVISRRGTVQGYVMVVVETSHISHHQRPPC